MVLLNEELASRMAEHKQISACDPEQPPFRKDVEIEEISAMIRHGILTKGQSNSKRSAKSNGEGLPKKVSQNQCDSGRNMRSH